MKRRILFLFLSMALFAALFVVGISATQSGTCGESLAWTLDDAGTLTISGTGAMTDFASLYDLPWGAYMESITSAVIEEGVTSIGKYAFANCANLETVTLPDSLTSIGRMAFLYCESITALHIPAALTDIGRWAFSECTALPAITVAEENPAFSADENGVLFNKDKTTLVYYPDGKTDDSYTVPNGVLIIGQDAFSYCDFSTVVIPEGVTTLESKAFEECANLTKVVIPVSISSIDNYAFQRCTALTIYGYAGSAAETHATANSIPFAALIASGTCGAEGDNLTWVLTEDGTLTISGTGAMEDYTSSAAMPWYSSKEYIRSVVLEEGVTSVGTMSFYAHRNLNSITLPSSVTSIGGSAFSGCTNLSSITIPSSVTSIGGSAFSSCTNLNSITIPSSVTSIGSYAFSGCTGLTNITISDSVTSIDSGAFNGCSSLTAIRVGVGNTSYSDIDGVLFDKSQTKLICFPAAKPDTAYAIPSGVTSIRDYAFYACTNLTSITLPDSVASIGNNAFKNCTGLTSIPIPASVTRIGFYAFQDCSSLMSITIPVHVTSIGRSVFKNCTGLTSITIPASVTSIDSTAFEGCTNFTIHGYVWSYAETYAAENSIPFVSHPITGTCGDALTWTLDGTGTLTVSGTEAMGNYSLNNKPWGAYMESITSAVIEEGVTSIGSYAFANCANLKTATLPDSLTSVGTVAFLYCEKLTALHIPAGVTWIGEYAFSECNSLTTITVAAENTAYSADENGVLFNKDETVLLNYPDGKTDDSYIIPDGVTTIGTGAFNYCDFTTVVIPEGVLVLKGNAFEKCENLTDITIPASVTDLASSALADCPNLTIHGYTGTAAETYATDHAIPFEALSEENILARGTCDEYITWILDKSGTLTISGKWAMPGYTSTLAPWDAYKEHITTVVIHREITSVGKSAFKDCTALKNVSLPAGLTSISESAFEGCTALTNISLPAEVDYIGAWAFKGCTALTNILLPARDTYIGSWAFSGCTALTAVTLPEGLTSIGPWAFSGCTALADVTLPESLTSIDNGAFLSCESLTSLHIPAGVTSIGTYAFSECNSLAAITVAEDNPAFSADENGVLFNKDKTLLINYPDGKTDDSYTVPNGVLTIGQEAFNYCDFTTVVLPEGVTTIETSAFKQCENLTAITIPSSVTSIGTGAFQNCSNLVIYGVTGSAADTYAQTNGISFVDPNPPTNGTCGENLTWVLDDTGTLTISGTGEMLNYNRNTMPWKGHLESITSVVIEEGATSIGNYAFYGCTNLSSIAIPAGVTSIGSYAFADCANLETITLPKSLTSIGGSAFSGCTALTAITLPEGLTSIGAWAFRGCTALTNIILPESLTSIGRAAFLYCESITTLHIPAALTDIGRWAFSECTALPAITVAEENPAFSADENGVLFNKDKTTLIYYPDGKTDDSYTIPAGVLVIGQDAFSYCDFSTVFIPEGVTTLESTAFEECANLTKVIIPASVTSIDNYAFQRCTALTIYGYAGSTAETHATANSIPFEALIASGTCGAEGDNLTWILTEDGTLTISGEGKMENGTPSWHNYRTSIQTVIISNGVTSIGNYAFLDCSSLTSVDIPASVTSFGYAAFSRCDSLTSIAIPEGVTSIGENAFFWSQNLTSVVLPDSVTMIGARAFCGCTGLTSITIPDSVISIGDGAFVSSALTSIEIPENTSFIGAGAFNKCYSLANINVAGENAYYCDIDGVLFSKDKTVLHTYLYGKTDTSYVIPAGVTTIGDWAFESCYRLENVTIPDSVTSIGNHTFQDCSALTNVTIPNEATSIGQNAFYGCPNLTIYGYADSTAETHATANSIPFEALIASGTCGAEGDNLTWILTEDGTLTISGTGAMYDSPNFSRMPWSSKRNAITSVVIEEGVTSIGDSAFYSCTNLTSITIPNSVTSIGDHAFHNCSGLKSIAIPNGVTSIGDAAFWGCTGLTSITIPDGVTSIGISTFRECTGLTKLTIPNGVTSIDLFAFADCTGLTSITIPESVTSISYSAFVGCTALTSIHVDGDNPNYCDIDGVLFDKDQTFIHTYPCGKQGTVYVIPNSVINIVSNAFDGCATLTDIILPESLISIGGSAFNGCTGLTSIAIPDNVTYIGSNAFSYCTGLTSITIPNSVTSIGYYAFRYCTGLTSITISNSVTSIDIGVFDGCPNVTIYGYAGSTAETYATANNIPFEAVNTIASAEWTSGFGRLNINLANINATESIQLTLKSTTGDPLTTMSMNVSDFQIIDNNAYVWSYVDGNWCFVTSDNSYFPIHQYMAVTGHRSPTAGILSHLGAVIDATCSFSEQTGWTISSDTLSGFFPFSSADIICQLYSVSGKTGTSVSEGGWVRTAWTPSEDVVPASLELTVDGKVTGTFALTVNAEEWKQSFVVITPTVNVPTATESNITLTAPEGGWKAGTNTFSVKADLPCAVVISHDGGKTYTKLTATANTDGSYSFTANNMTADTIISVAVRGDANGDGKADSSDAVAILRNLAGYDVPNFYEAIADFNGDGKADSSDAVAILRNLAGY